MEAALKQMEDGARLDTEAGALQNIVAWSADRPMWQRDALRRLCNKESLNEDDYEALLVIAKGDEAAAQPLESEHVPSPDAAYKTVNLKSIRDTNHVNALKPGECLSIEKGNGITVIYGDNGSGKSGYARILKSACRARMKDRQVIRPNIYDTNPGTPQANIQFSVEDQNYTAAWMQGSETDLQLSAISVFDSNTANVHVDEKNEVAYMRLGYSRSSTLLHSEGDSLNRPLPEPEVIENEIKCLRNWVVDIRDRQRKIDLAA